MRRSARIATVICFGVLGLLAMSPSAARASHSAGGPQVVAQNVPIDPCYYDPTLPNCAPVVKVTPDPTPPDPFDPKAWSAPCPVTGDLGDYVDRTLNSIISPTVTLSLIHTSLNIGETIFWGLGIFSIYGFLFKTLPTANTIYDMIRSTTFKMMSMLFMYALLMWAGGHFGMPLGPASLDAGTSLGQRFFAVSDRASGMTVIPTTPGQQFNLAICMAGKTYSAPMVADDIYVKTLGKASWNPLSWGNPLKGVLYFVTVIGPGLALSLPAAILTLVGLLLPALNLVALQFSANIIAAAGIFIVGFLATEWTNKYAFPYFQLVWTILLSQFFLVFINGLILRVYGSMQHLIILNITAHALTGLFDELLKMLVLSIFILVLGWHGMKMASSLTSGALGIDGTGVAEGIGGAVGAFALAARGAVMAAKLGGNAAKALGGGVFSQFKPAGAEIGAPSGGGGSQIGGPGSPAGKAPEVDASLGKVDPPAGTSSADASGAAPEAQRRALDPSTAQSFSAESAGEEKKEQQAQTRESHATTETTGGSGAESAEGETSTLAQAGAELAALSATPGRYGAARAAARRLASVAKRTMAQTSGTDAGAHGAVAAAASAIETSLASGGSGGGASAQPARDLAVATSVLTKGSSVAASSALATLATSLAQSAARHSNPAAAQALGASATRVARAAQALAGAQTSVSPGARIAAAADTVANVSSQGANAPAGARAAGGAALQQLGGAVGEFATAPDSHPETVANASEAVATGFDLLSGPGTTIPAVAMAAAGHFVEAAHHYQSAATLTGDPRYAAAAGAALDAARSLVPPPILAPTTQGAPTTPHTQAPTPASIGQQPVPSPAANGSAMSSPDTFHNEHLSSIHKRIATMERSLQNSALSPHAQLGRDAAQWLQKWSKPLAHHAPAPAPDIPHYHG